MQQRLEQLATLLGQQRLKGKQRNGPVAELQIATALPQALIEVGQQGEGPPVGQGVAQGCGSDRQGTGRRGARRRGGSGRNAPDQPQHLLGHRQLPQPARHDQPGQPAAGATAGPGLQPTAFGGDLGQTTAQEPCPQPGLQRRGGGGGGNRKVHQPSAIGQHLEGLEHALRRGLMQQALHRQGQPVGGLVCGIQRENEQHGHRAPALTGKGEVVGEGCRRFVAPQHPEHEIKVAGGFAHQAQVSHPGREPGLEPLTLPRRSKQQQPQPGPHARADRGLPWSCRLYDSISKPVARSISLSSSGGS